MLELQYYDLIRSKHKFRGYKTIYTKKDLRKANELTLTTKVTEDEDWHFIPK